MKKISVLICLFALGIPVSADIINPDLSPEQLQKMREQRLRMYVERQRFSTINRVCGTAISKDEIANCKKKLNEDYLETVKLLENKYVNKSAREVKDEH